MLLKNLSTVAREQGLLMDYIGDLVPGITRTITDKSSTANVKIETLELVNILVQSNPPKVFHPHVSVIVPSVLTAVNDSFYKITSEVSTLIPLHAVCLLFSHLVTRLGSVANAKCTLLRHADDRLWLCASCWWLFCDRPPRPQLSQRFNPWLWSCFRLSSGG